MSEQIAKADVRLGTVIGRQSASTLSRMSDNGAVFGLFVSPNEAGTASVASAVVDHYLNEATSRKQAIGATLLQQILIDSSHALRELWRHYKQPEDLSVAAALMMIIPKRDQAMYTGNVLAIGSYGLFKASNEEQIAFNPAANRAERIITTSIVSGISQASGISLNTESTIRQVSFTFAPDERIALALGPKVDGPFGGTVRKALHVTRTPKEAVDTILRTGPSGRSIAALVIDCAMGPENHPTVSHCRNWRHTGL